MDIELSLRELLVLENPGPRFTAGVMSRVGDAPAGLPRDGVVRLADARLRKRSRRILLVALLAVGAAAAMLPWITRRSAEAPQARELVAALADGSSPKDPALQGLAPTHFESSGDGHEPPDCVDPDVLRGLLLQTPAQNFRITASGSPELAEFKAPRQLKLVGNTERSIGTTVQFSSVYRTDLTPDAARSAAVGALTTGGWKLQAGDMFLTANVFTAVSYRSGENYCREGRPVNLVAGALDGVTYVALSMTRNQEDARGLANTCDQPQQPVARPVSALDQYMPKLELPRDPATGQTVPMQGAGGGNGEVERRMNVSFTIKDTADNVARYFAKQMAEQGWSSDGNWSGTGTAGSSWTRPGDGDAVLQGTLLLSAFAEGRFTAVFHVVVTK